MSKVNEGSAEGGSTRSKAFSARFLQPLLTPILLLVLGLSLLKFYSLPTLFTSGGEFSGNVSPKQTASAEDSLRLVGPPSTSTLPNDLLVIYVYFESEESRPNVEYFLKHGLHNNADFLLVLNGETDIDQMIPTASNIKVRRRDNSCYDLGTFGEVLEENNRALVRKYKRFIMMNSSIRGPFVPHWSQECWTSAYTSKVTDVVKLVGMSFNCQPTRHVQSMIWATDVVGLELLLVPSSLSTCHQDRDSAVNAETSTTALIMDAGYEVDVMLSAFRADPTYSRTCIEEDILYQDKYYGTSLNPHETMFLKNSAFRHINLKVVELLTSWTDSSNYSSYEACSSV